MVPFGRAGLKGFEDSKARSFGDGGRRKVGCDVDYSLPSAFYSPVLNPSTPEVLPYKKIPLASPVKGVGGFHFKVDNSNKILNRPQCLIQFLRIRPSRLGKIRTTPPGTSDMESNLLNQIVRLETMGQV